MSSARFRAIALALPGAEEKAHFGKADFRIKNKIFAGFTAEGMGYMKLTMEQQEMLCSAEPKLIAPVSGGWGRQGWTTVDQNAADEALLKSVLQMAWQNVAPKRLQK